MSKNEGYSKLLYKCKKVIDWKNRNGQCVFPYGGLFDLSKGLHISTFTDNGVVVSNGNQMAKIAYSELESEVIKSESSIFVRSLRDNARRCYELENFVV